VRGGQKRKRKELSGLKGEGVGNFKLGGVVSIKKNILNNII